MRFLDERIYEYMEEESADKLWVEKANEYHNLYKKIEKKLPIEFKQEYEKCFFHDYSIVSITPYLKEDFTYDILVFLKHESEMFKIVHKNVKSFKCNISFDESLYKIDFLLSEILPAKANCISHEFTLSGSDYSVIQIVCEQITLKK